MGVVVSSGDSGGSPTRHEDAVESLENESLERCSFVDRQVPELRPELGRDIADDPALAGSARCRVSLLGGLVGCPCRCRVCRLAHRRSDVHRWRASGGVGGGREGGLRFTGSRHGSCLPGSGNPVPELADLGGCLAPGGVLLGGEPFGEGPHVVEPLVHHDRCARDGVAGDGLASLRDERRADRRLGESRRVRWGACDLRELHRCADGGEVGDRCPAGDEG